jgi:hypothetical protein
LARDPERPAFGTMKHQQDAENERGRAFHYHIAS